jgi:hypothetical protein
LYCEDEVGKSLLSHYYRNYFLETVALTGATSTFGKTPLLIRLFEVPFEGKRPLIPFTEAETLTHPLSLVVSRRTQNFCDF